MLTCWSIAEPKRTGKNDCHDSHTPALIVILKSVRAIKVPSFRHGCRNPVPWTVTWLLHRCLIERKYQPIVSHPCVWIRYRGLTAPAIPAGMTSLNTHVYNDGRWSLGTIQAEAC